MPPSRHDSNPFATTMARDAAMAYAYHLYESSPPLPPVGLTHSPLLSAMTSPNLSTEDIYRFQLLPLLTTLRNLHPTHLPIMLLLACTHYSVGDYQASLALSHNILAIDANFVEAMSNIGTTYKAMGQEDLAYEWWWKALQIRPTYWDAMVGPDMQYAAPSNRAMLGQRARPVILNRSVNG